MKKQSQKTKEHIALENRNLQIKSIKEAYINLVKNNGFHPTRSQMTNSGHSNKTIDRLFGNITSLREICKKEYPEVFKYIFDESDFNDEKFENIKKEVRKHKRFVITTAVNGCNVHKNALKSVKEYCKKKNALLLILPSNDPAHNLDNRQGWNFDKLLYGEQIVFDEISLNSNIFISSILIGAKQIDPISGLSRITQSRGSAIFASPKQSLEFDATGSSKFPHARMTTGAITLPDYTTSKFMAERKAYIAKHDHVMGAIIVEITNDIEFHFRQIQFDTKGGFVDLGIYYNNNHSKKIKSKIVFGDYHAEEVDNNAKMAAEEIIKQVGCNEIIMQDFHNGTSLNHHNENKMITKAKLAEQGRLNFQRELDIDTKELNFWTSKKGIKQVTIVSSNHDEFIFRWLEEARFRNEPENTKIGCFLAYHAIEGLNPLKKALETFTKLKDQEKIKWLERDESYKYADFELGLHGDIAKNASRGSKKSIENSVTKAIIAHSHTPGILHRIIQVGTKSILRPAFVRGHSSWMHTDCLIYENGMFQLINIIGDKWKL